MMQQKGNSVLKNLVSIYVKTRMHLRIKRDIRRYQSNFKVVLGSGETKYKGWISTDYPALDITEADSFGKYFVQESISAILSEHVFEHLTSVEMNTALTQCLKYLAPGGYLRIAVPDGFHPDKSYNDQVKPGGCGHGADDHKILYNYELLQTVLQNAGFQVNLLEWFDETGAFHFTDWQPDTGFIHRSARFDKRNINNKLMYTSLIVDAVKG